MSQPTCCECGSELSLEVGIVRTGTLAEGSIDKLYCEPCAPNRGKGYTLADFERWREESQIARHERDIQLMDQLGPDVYFFMKEQVAAKAAHRPLKRYHNMLQSILDKFDELGMPPPDDDGGGPVSVVEETNP